MNLRKLFVVFALAPLFVTQHAVGSKPARPDRVVPQAPPSEWQRYRVEDEEFSVLFPVIPAMSTKSVTYALYQKRRERTLAAYADGVVYLIATYEKKGLSLDDLVHAVIPGQKTEAVTVDGISGRSLDHEDERSIWRRRFFETTKTLYQFVAVAPKVGDYSGGTSKFLSSISFRKTSDGHKVIDGPGAQPVIHPDGAQPDSIFRSSQVTTRPRIVTKPEPSYTEQARQSQVTGTVVLRGVLSSSGGVENISVIRELPDGLTERAIMAARKIRFIPATKDGQFVSMWIQLEYNFNLY